jgi:hypothetical protein
MIKQNTKRAKAPTKARPVYFAEEKSEESVRVEVTTDPDRIRAEQPRKGRCEAAARQHGMRHGHDRFSLAA